MNGVFISIENIRSAITKIKGSYEVQELADASVSFKVDKHIKIEIISKVKSELRKADFRKITYVSESIVVL